MDEVLWRDVSRLVLPHVPEALVLVVGLVVTIVLRRRIGVGDSAAIGGFALLALASVGGVCWDLWALSREHAPISMSDSGQPQPPAGLEFVYAMDRTVTIAQTVLYLVGLVCVTAAVFVGRRRVPAERAE